MDRFEFDVVEAFLMPLLKIHEAGTVWDSVLEIGKSWFIKCIF